MDPEPTTEDVLRQFNPHARLTIHDVIDPAATLELLTDAANSPDRWVRCRIAEHRNADLDLVVRLLSDPHPTVRGSTKTAIMGRGRHRMTPTVVTTLLAHPNRHVRVAMIEYCSRSQLNLLAHDSTVTVRSAVGSSPRITSAIALHLADDKSTRVRATLPRNPATPRSVLRKLTSDPVTSIRQNAAMTIEWHKLGGTPEAWQTILAAHRAAQRHVT